jgi:hypothetical protein
MLDTAQRIRPFVVQLDADTAAAELLGDTHRRPRPRERVEHDVCPGNVDARMQRRASSSGNGARCGSPSPPGGNVPDAAGLDELRRIEPGRRIPPVPSFGRSA